MSNSVFITGVGPGSGKSVVVLGVMELLARHGRKIGFFRPVVAEGAIPDYLAALVTSRYEITVPHESMFGATHATARDLISRDNVTSFR
jgi:phosphate acetyltransferase